MKPKNRMMWLFILLVVIIFLGASMGTYESFVAAPRARARVAYNNNNMESFIAAPRARVAYNNNNSESFIAAPRARMAYNNNNM